LLQVIDAAGVRVKLGAMTLDEMSDREAIRKTLAKYNIDGDRGQVDGFVATFTEDAVFESGGSFRCEGREAIRRWFGELVGGGREKPAAAADAPPARNFLRHQISTSVIEITGPGRARAQTYFNVYSNIGPDHMGVYTDELRKTGDGWLIAHRDIRTDWIAEQSYFSGRRRAPNFGQEPSPSQPRAHGRTEESSR
jgi:ketosteroid isomerase-like protein